MWRRVLVFLCLVSGLFLVRYQYLEMRRIARFQDYLRKFNKSYSAEEFKKRLQYFEISLENIEKLNSKEHGTGALHGFTKFSDWSEEEYHAIMIRPGGNTGFEDYPKCSPFHQSCNDETNGYRATSNLIHKYMDNDNEVDWRKKGVIGPVQDQKQCNGCWAFGIIGLMESMSAIQNLGYQQLSVQQLLDCSVGTKQCSGGNINIALIWLCMEKVRITTAEQYPLILVNETCKMHTTEGRRLMNYTISCAVQTSDLLRQVAMGPVMAVVLASPWQNYIGGIIQRNCVDFADVPILHVVQIVGYNNDAPIPYYIIKNSYGTDFGEDGYVRLAIQDNVCGVRNQIGYLYVVEE